jgi:hypothetical protein
MHSLIPKSAAGIHVKEKKALASPLANLEAIDNNRLSSICQQENRFNEPSPRIPFPASHLRLSGEIDASGASD